MESTDQADPSFFLPELHEIDGTTLFLFFFSYPPFLWTELLYFCPHSGLKMLELGSGQKGRNCATYSLNAPLCRASEASIKLDCFEN